MTDGFHGHKWEKEAIKKIHFNFIDFINIFLLFIRCKLDGSEQNQPPITKINDLN